MSIKSSLGSAASSASSTVSAASARVRKITVRNAAISLAFVAAFTAIWTKSGAPMWGYEQLVFSLAIGIAAMLFEYDAAKQAANAWFDRSPGTVAMYGIVWLAAFSYAAVNWMGVAAEGESAKSNIVKASFTTYADSRTNVEAQRKRVNAEESSIAQLKAMSWQELPKVAGKPISSPEAAKAIMDAAKEGSNRHTQAKVAFADLTERRQWQEKIDTAEKQLAKARTELANALTVAGSTKAVTSDVRADLKFLTKYAGMSQDSAEDFSGYIKIAVLSAFISLGAVLGIYEQRKGEQRKPWFNGRGMIARIRRAWDGTDHTIVNNYSTTHSVGRILHTPASA